MALTDLPHTEKPITSAVIVSKVFRRPLSGAILELAGLLEKYGIKTYIEQTTSVGFNLPQLQSVSRRQIKDLDLIVVLGGDGSMLGAARTLVDLGVPMLGVNRGHLGLLTDVSPANLEETIKRIVQGRYFKEERTILDMRVFREDDDGAGELVGQSLATNETVIHSGMMAHMMVFKVTINGSYMYTLRGDGMIVNTPTGSTAYSLSAGGPIIEPHLDVLALVPMFPQSLNCSPIIIPGKSEVRIDFLSSDDTPEWVNINCDGQVSVRADSKCSVLIRQHRMPLTLIHPEGYDYYSLLRQKLGWGKALV
ncbi:MAG: NAD(+)/NADH kinase [Proteobacteria bacterium]|uniref:NAD kinase n=1 Tax=Candidatus Avisuccinivibrio stercorigallinarum TaxID=2840704 RepID=A0A9D9D8E3_9GAMM|nr:NAD(+)/NADH kinase [Candidatus Avisuccinivibrio stercorigallinarum]